MTECPSHGSELVLSEKFCGASEKNSTTEVFIIIMDNNNSLVKVRLAQTKAIQRSFAGARLKM